MLFNFTSRMILIGARCIHHKMHLSQNPISRKVPDFSRNLPINTQPPGLKHPANKLHCDSARDPSQLEEFEIDDKDMYPKAHTKLDKVKCPMFRSKTYVIRFSVADPRIYLLAYTWSIADASHMLLLR